MPPDRKEGKMIAAFQRELGREAHIVRMAWGAEKKRYFLSEKVQKIFQKLCEMPCATADNIAKAMKTSSSSARWHIGKLVRGGFIVRSVLRGTCVFYPADLVEDSEVELLCFIHRETPGTIYRIILRTPGISQKEIGSTIGLKAASVIRHLAVLERLGLATHIIDGKYKRYYATDRIAALYSGKRKRVRLFREGLLKRLRMEMYSIEILRSTHEILSLKLSTGTRASVINIHVNPYMSFMRRETSAGAHEETDQ